MPHSTMVTAASPLPWQQALGAQLALALHEALRMHPPASDSPLASAGATVLASEWCVPPAADQPGVRALAAQPSSAALYAQCLRHYRQHLRSQDRTLDDAGAALACFLAAVLQANDCAPVTLHRWGRVLAWLRREVMPAVSWQAASLTEQQQFFERMAALAAAIGEWTVQASRQGPVALASARSMARQHLQHELGVSDALLVKAWHWLQTDAQKDPHIAGDPDCGEPELPTAPTRQARGGGL